MMKKRISATAAVFFLCAIGIAVLAVGPFNFNNEKPQERHRTRIIVPSAEDGFGLDSVFMEQIAYEDSYILKAFLSDDEHAISVLNYDFDNNAIEDQIAAYRSQYDSESPVCITFFAFDERTRAYRRYWSEPTAATMPGTVSLYMQDLLGDRSICVIVTGMNNEGEHTMTIFHNNIQEDRNRPFAKIAEIQMDGSITIQETERTAAYRQGIAGGQPFVITAYGRDIESENLLDRIEITYEYNQLKGIYERSKISRIPGSQIEQRRLREILSGNAKVFEEFINDLWYHVDPDGTINRSQYLYFDPAMREIIFYEDETQQIFTWQHSNSTRYGLYISSQNISVTTLRRMLDIEMESLDSIRLRISDDVTVKLIIGASASWDGMYRRAGSLARSSGTERTVQPYTDAVYDSSMGRLQFHANGEYDLSSGGSLTNGRYVFFRVDDRDLLELRPEHNGKNESTENRLIYHIVNANRIEDDDIPKLQNLSLSRVRLGTTGIQDLHEGQILLTRAR